MGLLDLVKEEKVQTGIKCILCGKRIKDTDATFDLTEEYSLEGHVVIPVGKAHELCVAKMVGYVKNGCKAPYIKKEVKEAVEAQPGTAE